MRILIVCQYFWPENFRINDLTAGLAGKGHEVTVLTGIPNYPEGNFYPGYNLFRNTRQNYCGARVIRVPIIPRGKGSSLNLILNYFSFVVSGVLLAPFLCRGEYDVIFVHGLSPILMAFPAILLKKIKKKPLLLYVLDLWPESVSAVGACKSSLIIRGIAGIVRFIYRHCNHILVSSSGFVERIRAMGVERSRISYWPQWAEENYRIVPVEHGSPESLRMPAGFRIMFAGNIGAAQGFKTIIEAADALKGVADIHWIILGDGRMRPWLEVEVRSRKLEHNVHLLGRHPVESMPRYFALADVLLVSLKNDPVFALTLPAKISSYMACGRPILARLNGEGARIVEEAGAGISCPVDDSECLAKAVLKMYNATDAQRREMGMRGRAYFEKHFSRDILLAQFEEWIGSLSKNGDLRCHDEASF